MGDLGEKLSPEYEIRRLKEEGSDELAYTVKRVSATDPYAGHESRSTGPDGSPRAEMRRQGCPKAETAEVGRLKASARRMQDRELRVQLPASP